MSETGFNGITPQVMPAVPNNVQIVMDMIRRFLRDNAKLNKLIQREETDDDTLKLCINMAISDWNTTPPLLNPVGLQGFPSMDWLILASSMFLLESAGILHYRNELPYNDNGVSVNPWSKGPQYTSFAGMLANFVEKKKVEFKTAFNIAQTFGIVKSPEYRMWDYSGLYAGAQFNDYGTGSMTAAPGGSLPYSPATPSVAPSRTPAFYFQVSTWTANPLTGNYEIIFNHNLNKDVDVRITNPSNGEDLRNRCSIRFANANSLIISVPLSDPNNRFEGQMIAFIL